MHLKMQVMWLITSRFYTLKRDQCLNKNGIILKTMERLNLELNRIPSVYKGDIIIMHFTGDIEKVNITFELCFVWCNNVFDVQFYVPANCCVYKFFTMGSTRVDCLPLIDDWELTEN